MSVSALGQARHAPLTALAGPGIAAAAPGQRAMLELEALQVLQTSEFKTVLPDPMVQSLDPRIAARFIDEFRSKLLSKSLRAVLDESRSSASPGAALPPRPSAASEPPPKPMAALLQSMRASRRRRSRPRVCCGYSHTIPRYRPLSTRSASTMP